MSSQMLYISRIRSLQAFREKLSKRIAKSVGYEAALAGGLLRDRFIFFHNKQTVGVFR